jgi:hypothetical protein
MDLSLHLRRDSQFGTTGLGDPDSKRLKNEKADDRSLEQEENCIKLMIALISRDCSSHQACEIKHATGKICRSQGKKMRHAF